MDQHLGLAVPIPQGTKDLLPGDAGCKRAMEEMYAKLFSQWGYEEVVTPTMEFYQTLAAGGCNLDNMMYKFVDKENHIIALRTDMTTPIARLAATRLKDRELPLRLFYLANVFRYEQVQAGRQCEFYQAGVELLGYGGPAADAEVIALAIEAMQRSGLVQVQVSIGNIEFMNGVMEQCDLSPALRHGMKQALLQRNFVELEELLQQSVLTAEQRALIMQIPLLHGGREVIERVRSQVSNQRSIAALDNIRAIYDLLCAYDVEDCVQIDLGIIRDLDYYTGMVFEAYTPGLGFPVCGGGRYDRLLTQFGRECEATGFALGLERIMLALERQGVERNAGQPKGFFIAYGPGKRLNALQVAKELRSQGFHVEVDIVERCAADCEQYACGKNLELIRYGD